MLVKAKGYHVVVTTWENDADFYKTESAHYENPEDVEKAVKIIRMFTSRNNKKFPGVGNAQERDIPKLFEAFYNLVEANPGIIPITLEDIEEDRVDVYALLEHIPEVGILSSEYYMTRVVETIRVEYYPEDVHCEDKTDEFNASVAWR